MQIKSQRLTRQIFYFLIAGISAVSIDYFVYRITLNLLGTVISKIFGFYAGAILSFFINGSYTFRKKGRILLTSNYFYRYIFFLTVGMFLNTTVNYYLLNTFYRFTNITFLAFLIATLVSMTFNFLVIKLIVFR